MLKRSPQFLSHPAGQRRRAVTRRVPAPSPTVAVPTPIARTGLAPSPDTDAWQAVGGLAASLAAELATRRAKARP